MFKFLTRARLSCGGAIVGLSIAGALGAGHEVIWWCGIAGFGISYGWMWLNGT